MIRSFGQSWESGRTATGASARDGGASTGREDDAADFEGRDARGRAGAGVDVGVGAVTGDDADAADFALREGRGAGVNARIN